MNKNNEHIPASTWQWEKVGEVEEKIFEGEKALLFSKGPNIQYETLIPFNNTNTTSDYVLVKDY